MTRGTGDTPQRALEAAQRLFALRGYDRTTMIDIAGELDLTSAALYYHFKSKDELLCDLVEPLLNAVDGVLAGAVPTPGKSTDARRLLSEYFEVLAQRRPIVCFVSQDPAVVHHPDIGRRLADQQARVEELLCGGDRKGPARARAAAALGALWRPVTSLEEQELRANQQTIVGAAVRALGSGGRVAGTGG